MTIKTIYEQLNDEICDNVSLLIKTEKINFEILKTVLSGYLKYIGYEKDAKLLHLDQNINPVGITNDKYFEERISCLVQDNNGFWYMGFLLEFYKKYSDKDIIEPTDSTIIGVKENNGSFQLKLLNTDKTYDTSKPEELVKFYEKIVEEIKSDFSLNLILKNKVAKKIGF